jgi:hypothetical protein
MALAGYPRKLTFHTLLRPSRTGMFSSRGAVLKCSSTSFAPIERTLSQRGCTRRSSFPYSLAGIVSCVGSMLLVAQYLSGCLLLGHAGGANLYLC